MPCYNPISEWEKNVVSSFLAISKLLEGVSLELILVNDGSTTAISKEKIAFIKNKIVNFSYIDLKENKGKGAAIRTGVENAKYDQVIFTDIDFPYTIASFLEIAEGLNEGADIISFVRDESYYAKIPLFRKIISRVLRWSMQFLFQLPVNDTQAGLKGFSKKGKVLLLSTKINRYLFDIELFKLAGKRNDIRIKCYPANLREETSLGALSLSLILSELKTFYTIWRM